MIFSMTVWMMFWMTLDDLLDDVDSRLQIPDSGVTPDG